MDVLGGDHAPQEILSGVAQALREDFQAGELLLVGPEGLVAEGLRAQGIRELPPIVSTDQVVACHEPPVEGLRRKPRASVLLCAQAVRQREADGFLSFGNTGAAVASATMVLGLLPGIRRPGIAVSFIGSGGPFVVLDVGANPNARAIHLLQYALMGSAYAQDLLGIPEPRVALLNIGGEAGKGSQVQKESYRLLEGASCRFVGNLEGQQLFDGAADVLVTDGFVGNMILKVLEGFAEFLAKEIGRRAPDVSDSLRVKMRELVGAADFAEVGGAALLGVDGAVVVGHGRSRAHAVPAALRVARSDVECGVNRHITDSLPRNPIAAESGEAS